MPDALRRIELPEDLDEVTTAGGEDDPAEGGMTRDSVEAIWEAAVDLSTEAASTRRCRCASGARAP